MIASVERDKPCAWDFGGQNPPFFRGYNSIAVAVEDDGGHGDQGQEMPDAELSRISTNTSLSVRHSQTPVRFPSLSGILIGFSQGCK